MKGRGEGEGGVGRKGAIIIMVTPLPNVFRYEPSIIKIYKEN